MSKLNSGSMRVNPRKEKDTHPDRTGTINVAGVDYWISGWLKETNGEKWLSLSVKPKEARATQPEGEKPASGSWD